MKQLHKALHQQIAALPRMALQPILERKLQAQGVNLPRQALDALLTHFLSGQGDKFVWSDGDTEAPDVSQELNLVFDEADANEFESITQRVVRIIPEVVQSALAESAKRLLEGLKKGWEVEGAIQRFEIDEFRERLEVRWGGGLQLLRMLLTSVREVGNNVIKSYNRSKSAAYACRRFVLVRLHVRACQVADEIITLLENGFADGAMARWRTLHEIGVVATIIEDGNEELARRFIDHDVVEVKKQADDWDEKRVPLGYAQTTPRERKRIEREYKEVIIRYGESFRHDYGWAAEYLKDKRPSFKKLQARADQSGMNTYYKLANFNACWGERHVLSPHGHGCGHAYCRT